MRCITRPGTAQNLSICKTQKTKKSCEPNPPGITARITRSPDDAGTLAALSEKSDFMAGYFRQLPRTGNTLRTARFICSNRTARLPV